jgi:putative holliday junction resolvase
MKAMPDLDTPPQIVLGFDFGLRYIGTAVGQTLTSNARPLGVLHANDGIPCWTTLAKLINDWQPQLLLVGHPLNMDGSSSQITFCAEKFANRLQTKFRLPVHLVDERLSTRAAYEQLPDKQKHSNKKRRKTIDSLAAQVIVQQWLDQRS